MAKSKNSKRKTKSPVKKKCRPVKQRQSLFPALVFLALAAGLIGALYFLVGNHPPQKSSLQHNVTAPKPRQQPKPIQSTDIKLKDKPLQPAKHSLTQPSHITIYRLSSDFNRTISHSVPVENNLTKLEMARLIIRYLTLPGERDQPPLPAATRVLSVSFTASLITIDLSNDIRKELINSGANDEMLTIACLTNSLLKNFPDFKTLQILINGEKSNTLAGHIDISQPLGYQSTSN